MLSGIERAAASVTTHAADFKDVGKIGRKCDADGHAQGIEPIVCDEQLFVGNITPQETRANQMQCAAGDDDILILGHINIGEIRNKGEIVGLDGRAQEQGPSVPETQDKLRQVPCATEEDTVLAEA